MEDVGLMHAAPEPPVGGYYAFMCAPKEVRTGYLTDALEKEGFVLGQYLHDRERHVFRAKKISEELREAGDALINWQIHNGELAPEGSADVLREKLVGEFADAFHALQCGFRLWGVMLEREPHIFRNPRLAEQAWQRKTQVLGKIPLNTHRVWEELSALVLDTDNTYLKLLARKDVAIPFTEVKAAMTAKMRRWGVLEGWSVRGMALPDTDDCREAIGRLRANPTWTEIPFTDFNAKDSLTFDMIYAVTPQG